MLGMTLEDPNKIESNKEINIYSLEGMKLLPIKTVYREKKQNSQREEIIRWPEQEKVKGFEMHFGESKLIENSDNKDATPLFRGNSLGWFIENKEENFIGGTYLHGLFDNGRWRRHFLNKIRIKKGLKSLTTNEINYSEKREKIIDLLTDSFEKNINLKKII